MPTTFRTVRLIFVFFLLMAARAGAQSDQRVSIDPAIDGSSITVGRAIELIADQTAYKPSFVNQNIPFSKVLTLISQSLSVEELLNLIVDNEQLSYEFRGNLILIKAKPRRQIVRDESVTLKGRVKEAVTGEVLIGATVWVDSLKLGTSTNAYGFYSLSIPRGNYLVRVSFVGFEADEKAIDIQRNMDVDFNLELLQSKLPEIVISPADFELVLSNRNTSYHKIGRNIFGRIPYFLSEVDVLQGTLLLPGIRNVGEDASGINVRGGSTDNNLILLDEATIFNTSHFFGLISVFNPDAVNDIEIFKGDIPASYGGRVSSVVNVRQREGNKEAYSFSGGIGLLSGRLLAEGPLVKHKSSFLVSARSSLFNVNYDFFGESGVRQSTVNFKDMNMKLNYEVNKRNKFYLSGYTGSDRNRIGETFQRTWGNNALTGRWNHVFGERLFSNHTFTISDYSYRTQDPSAISNFVGTSYIFNYTAKSDFNFYQKPGSSFNFGHSVIFHRLNPGDRIPLSEDASVVEIKLDTEHAFEPSFYTSWEKDWTRKLASVAGLRWSRFYYLGPSSVYTYVEGQPRSTSSILDTLSYKAGEVIDFYNGWEPRVVVSYALTGKSSVKASYNRGYQYIHRISNSISPAPTDIWKLSDSYVRPERSDQLSLGYYRKLLGGLLEMSLETYYRSLSNNIAFKDGADLILNETIETEILQGIGRAYGSELLLRKPDGDFRWWISYTLSKSETKIHGESEEETINGGEYFPSDFDKTHDASMVGIYALSERWSFSGTFNYSTGRPVTFPASKYVYDGVIVPNFTQRNQGRLSDYHRLDFSATRNNKVKEGKKWISSWTFSVYNIYGRRNAYSYLFRQSQSNPLQTEIIRYSILGTVIPSVSYNFKF